jgi:hypothetical protein
VQEYAASGDGAFAESWERFGELPATDTRPEPFPDTVATGVWPRRAQVRAFGGRSDCPASSSKHKRASRRR